MADTKQSDMSRALQIMQEAISGHELCLGCSPSECDILLKMSVKQAIMERKIKELERIV